MRTDPRRVKELFGAALELPDAPARRAYLDRECGADAALRRRLDVLLRAHDDPASVLERPLAEVVAPGQDATGAEGPSQLPPDDAAPGAESVGTVLAGRYKMLEAIGEGGMGSVWMAQQTEPVRRLVALKLIKPGMDTRQVVARFEAERQALALMDHPNIAKVHDAGTTPDGRPFFVMELVKGMPITQYCDGHRLTPRQRLELFVPVCRAVQHAHQKGVIHRDIKPSNVLVAAYDGRAVPKVIDFGIAKAAGQPLTEQTLVTGFGAVVGTPEYMSPEQAELNALDVDTRSDVYSLGVLLYELLTGTTPLTRKRLREEGLLEVLRIIREEEPPRPSTRLSSTEELPAIASRRSLEPRKLSGVVRGELDWIVMRALEKDRNRRYESANAFAADVERYLNDEPVQACPPSAAYRLRKFARRNRAGLAVAAGLLLLLTGISGAVGWAAYERATRQGEKEQRQTRVNRELSDALADVAGLRERARAARPGDAGPWTRVREALRAAETLAGSELADPVLVERVRVLSAELEQDDKDRRMVARVEEIRLRQGGFMRQEDVARARREYEDAFRDYGLPVLTMEVEDAARRIAASPIRDGLTAALDAWADAGEAWGVRLLDIARRAVDDPWRQQYYAARTGSMDEQQWQENQQRLVRRPEALAQPPATIYQIAHWVDRPEGIRLLRKAQRRHPGDVFINSALGILLIQEAGGLPPGEEQERRWVEALGFLRAALAARPESQALREQLGTSLANLGGQVMGDRQSRDRLLAALPYFSESVEWLPERPNPWASRGEVYSLLERWDEALADYSKAIEVAPEDPEWRRQRAMFYQQRQRWDAALADLAKVVELAPNDPLASDAYAKSCVSLGHRDEALAECARAVASWPNDPRAWQTRACVYTMLEQYDKALADFSKAIEVDPKSGEAWRARAAFHDQRGRWEQALADYSRAIELQPNDPWAWFDRGHAYRRRGDLEKALADFSRCAEVDPKHPAFWLARGDVHSQSGRWDEAVDDYAKAVDASPGGDNAGALHSRANAYRKLGLWDKAVADYEASVAASPRSTGPRTDLAWLLATCPDPKIRNPGRAVELARKDLDLQPQWGPGWRTLGVAQYRAGDWKAAIEWLNKSAELSRGGDAVDRLFLAMTHRQLGNPDEARNQYRLAVQWLERNKAALEKDKPLAEELRRFRDEAEGVLGLKE